MAHGARHTHAQSLTAAQHTSTVHPPDHSTDQDTSHMKNTAKRCHRSTPHHPVIPVHRARPAVIGLDHSPQTSTDY